MYGIPPQKSSCECPTPDLSTQHQHDQISPRGSQSHYYAIEVTCKHLTEISPHPTMKYSHRCPCGLKIRNFSSHFRLQKSNHCKSHLVLIKNITSRAWCKTIVTTLFYILSYNSFAPDPRLRP